MKEGADLLGRVRVASPCPASWEAMEGDGRVRFCRQCELHVYDLSALTSAEAGSLVARTEGRLCARLYRRADGTVLTSDCPRGLAAARRRVARAAGAALAAVLGLCGGAFGQGKGKGSDSCESGTVRVERVASPGRGSTLKGKVVDPAQGAVPRARVLLVGKDSKQKYTATASDEGVFEFQSLPPGTYTVEISSPGFRPFELKQLAVGPDEVVQLDLALGLGSYVEMGVVVVDDMTPTSPRNGNGVHVFTSKEITRLPHE
ncbi:MAG TPA: carboxypeptidase-like regulatory domain-containing protein [Pyrinomonadaceae bacterium]|nr:carboxypeptidase-like regulatory domain-containing protein [Pyrinomonadaceae bacterium]